MRGGSSVEDLSNSAASSNCTDEIERKGTYINNEASSIFNESIEQVEEEEVFSDADDIGYDYDDLNDSCEEYLPHLHVVDEEEDDLFEENDSDSTTIVDSDTVIKIPITRQKEIKDLIEERESDESSIILTLTQEEEDAILWQEEAFPDVPTCTEDPNSDAELFDDDVGDEMDRTVNFNSAGNMGDLNFVDPESIVDDEYSNLTGDDAIIDDNYDADADPNPDPFLLPPEVSVDLTQNESEEADDINDCGIDKRHKEASSSEGNQFSPEVDNLYDILEDLSQGNQVGVESQYFHAEEQKYEAHYHSDDKASDHASSPEQLNHIDSHSDNLYEDLNEDGEYDSLEDLREGIQVGVESHYFHDEVHVNSNDDEVQEYEARYHSDDKADDYTPHPEQSNHLGNHSGNLYKDLNEDGEYDTPEDLREGIQVGVESQYNHGVNVNSHDDEEQEYEAHYHSDDKTDDHTPHPEQSIHPGIYSDNLYEDLNEDVEYGILEDLSQRIQGSEESHFHDEVSGYLQHEVISHSDDKANHHTSHSEQSNHPGIYSENLCENLENSESCQVLFDGVGTSNSGDVSMQASHVRKMVEDPFDVQLSACIEAADQVEDLSRNQAFVDAGGTKPGNKYTPRKHAPSDEKIDYSNTTSQDLFVPGQTIGDGDSSDIQSSIHEYGGSEVTQDVLSNNLETRHVEVDEDTTHGANRVDIQAEREDSIRNLSLDITMDTDLDIGSDSAAFVDRMDLADAYDDDDKFNERTDDDGLSTSEDLLTDAKPSVVQTKANTFLDKIQHIRPLAFMKEKASLSDVILPIQETKHVFIKKMQQWRLSMSAISKTSEDAHTLRRLGYSSEEINALKPDIKFVFAKKGFRKPRNGLPDIVFDSIPTEKERTIFGLDAKVMRRISASTFAACLALALQSTNIRRNYAHEQEPPEGPKDLSVGRKAERPRYGVNSFVSIHDTDQRYRQRSNK